MSVRQSISTSLENKILTVLRGMGLPVSAVGLMEVAAEGVQKEQDLSSVQVRVFNMAQVTEASGMFTVNAELRLNVEQAESANGGAFLEAHEKIALWLEHVMIGSCCEELDTDEVYVDGLQRTGGDKDFDTSGGEWFAVWNLTLSGRLKENTNNEQE